MQRRLWFVAPTVMLLGALLVAAVLAGRTGSAAFAAPASGLHVQGNQLFNASGQRVQLHGVDRSGTEYACIQGWGIFDGPSDVASVQAIASWHANAVRVPLNEDCWLGINGAPAAYSGATYRTAITNYVNLLTGNGLVAILDLHWNASGAAKATGQQPMADQDHAPAFWTSVAGAFKGNTAVIFDLYNEPYPDSNQDTTAAWKCWRDGGACPGVSFTAAGMQELVTDVRNTGATNIILLGGVQWGGTVTQWLAYKPVDPLNNLVAGVHSYNFGGCTTSTCWNADYGSVTSAVPLIAGEIGETDCQSSYITPLMNWFDSHQQSYLAWTWDTWGAGCSALSLISSYAGTPATAYGAGYQAHLAGFAGSPSPSPSPSPTPSPTPSPSPSPSPKFTTSGSATPGSIARGGKETLNAAVTSVTATKVLVDIEVYNSANVKVDQQFWDNQTFAAGQVRNYSTTWTVPSGTAPGVYTLKIGIFSPGWGTDYTWNNGAAQFTVK